MQTPEPEGKWEPSVASLTLGHRHRHSTGAGRPRGTRDREEGQETPLADDPRTGDKTQRGRAEWHGVGGGGEACSSESPLPS